MEEVYFPLCVISLEDFGVTEYSKGVWTALAGTIFPVTLDNCVKNAKISIDYLRTTRLMRFICYVLHIEQGTKSCRHTLEQHVFLLLAIINSLTPRLSGSCARLVAASPNIVSYANDTIF